jgi:hypothetical protein
MFSGENLKPGISSMVFDRAVELQELVEMESPNIKEAG